MQFAFEAGSYIMTYRKSWVETFKENQVSCGNQHL